MASRKKDPEQIHNVYAAPEYAKTVVKLKSELTRLRELYKDSDAIAPDLVKKQRKQEAGVPE